jgi:gliding motility-associated-like protein
LVDEIDFEPEVIVPIGKLSWAWYKDKYPGGELISDEKSVIVHPTEKTVYFCEITTCSGLIYVDDITINAIPAPNAFNPNSVSSENREFKFYTDQPERIKNFVIYIYNRWGQLVFETADFEKGWDGTFNDQPCSAGDYVWTIYYKGEEESSTSKGVVTLVKLDIELFHKVSQRIHEVTQRKKSRRSETLFLNSNI